MEQIKQNNNNVRHFALTALSASMLMVNTSVFAMQALDDHDLSRIDGQDGIEVSTSYDQIDIDQLYWEDNAGSSSGTTAGGAGFSKNLRANANSVKIRDTSPNYDLGTTIKVDTGSNGSTAGLDLQVISNPSTISIDEFKICDTATIQVCGSPLGRLAIQTTAPLTFGLTTQDGLFNNSSQSILNLGINSANIFLGLVSPDNAAWNNQLILKNFNFNFTGKGAMFIDDKAGIRLQTNVGDMSINSSTGKPITYASTTQTPDSTYGYVDLTRVEDTDTSLTAGTYANGTGHATNAGLNLEIMTKQNVDVSSYNPSLAVSSSNPSPYNLTNAKGLIRVGASGRIVNAYVQLRGTDATGLAAPSGTNLNNILGSATTAANANPSGADATVIGKSGIAFRMRGEFTKPNDSMLGTNGSPTTLEIGGAGLNTYGFEFGKLSVLRSDDTASRAYFDSGNIYVNLVDTKTLLLPQNYTFQNSRFGGTAGSYLTSAADYVQNVHTDTSNINPYAIAMAIRGAEFQALSKSGRFTNSANVSAGDQIKQTGSEATLGGADGANNQWGLALPFYNLNANLAMYGSQTSAQVPGYIYKTDDSTPTTVANGTQRIGFSLAMSADGIDRDSSGNKIGTKTTSILVIDGGDKDASTPGVQSTDYYMGLRNIDMLLKGTGSIGVESGSVNVSLPNLLIVMAGEVAAGYLPGATYKTCPTGVSVCAAPIDNFALKNDVLFGLKLRLAGSMNFSLIPNSAIGATNGNRLSIVGDLTIPAGTTGNTIQISDPADGSTLGLDNLVGKLAFNNAIVISKDKNAASSTNGSGVVGFNAAITFNPDHSIDGVFRAKDINFYPPSTSNGVGQRLGELAITGGKLTSNLNIIPRNGSFGY